MSEVLPLLDRSDDEDRAAVTRAALQLRELPRDARRDDVHARDLEMRKEIE